MNQKKNQYAFAVQKVCALRILIFITDFQYKFDRKKWQTITN